MLRVWGRGKDGGRHGIYHPSPRTSVSAALEAARALGGSSCSGFLTRRAIGTATSWDHSWNCQLERRPRQPQPGPGDVCWGRGVGQWTGGPAQETDAPNPVTRPGDPAGPLFSFDGSSLCLSPLGRGRLPAARPGQGSCGIRNKAWQPRAHVRQDSSSRGWETHGWGRGCRDRLAWNFLSSAEAREDLYQTSHCGVFSRKLRMWPRVCPAVAGASTLGPGLSPSGVGLGAEAGPGRVHSPPTLPSTLLSEGHTDPQTS